MLNPTPALQECKETIERMYLECYTSDEIAEEVGLKKPTIEEKIQLYMEMEATSKTMQSANFQDDFDVPIYNRWSYPRMKSGRMPGS